VASASEFTFFDTRVGKTGILWGSRGLVGVQLPAANAATTRKTLLARFPGAVEGKPPAAVRRAIEQISALIETGSGDLSKLELDMDGVPPFHRRVYELARTIEPGSTLSYGDVATKLGAPGSARAVGQALGRNPFAIVVPCHRVLAANGKIGGFSAGGGIVTKHRLLTIEQASKPPSDAQLEGDGTLRVDPKAAATALAKMDPKLAKLIDKVGPPHFRARSLSSIFHALAEAIVYQQLNGRAAATIFARVCALFPRGHEGLTPQAILRAPDERLRGAGLSQNKLLSLKDLAAKARAGEIPTLAEAHGMSDDELIEKLTAVRGIGRWTVEMLLMFRLGRPDILPVDDFGVRKGYMVTYGKREMPKPKELAKIGEKWSPHRTTASWYFWRAADLAPD